MYVSVGDGCFLLLKACTFQAWNFTGATKAIASMHPGHYLGALQRRQLPQCTLVITLVPWYLRFPHRVPLTKMNALVFLPFQKKKHTGVTFFVDCETLPVYARQQLQFYKAETTASAFLGEVDDFLVYLARHLATSTFWNYHSAIAAVNKKVLWTQNCSF